MFEYEIRCKVTKIDLKWDTYRNTLKPYIVDELDSILNAAAKTALETKNYGYFINEAERYSEFGACDTEPRAQFDELWIKVYGYEGRSY